MASLNYMQTTTFKVFFRFFLLAMISVLLRLLRVCCMLWCMFHKGSILWAKVKMSMQHQRKHISPNFNLLQNYFLRCHFFILRIWCNSFETWNKWWFTTHKIRRGQYFLMSCIVRPFFSMITIYSKTLVAKFDVWTWWARFFKIFEPTAK